MAVSAGAVVNLLPGVAAPPGVPDGVVVDGDVLSFVLGVRPPGPAFAPVAAPLLASIPLPGGAGSAVPLGLPGSTWPGVRVPCCFAPCGVVPCCGTGVVAVALAGMILGVAVLAFVSMNSCLGINDGSLLIAAAFVASDGEPV